jgi:hypothetical protein
MLNLIQHPEVACTTCRAWPHWTLNQVQGDDSDLTQVALTAVIRVNRDIAVGQVTGPDGGFSVP